MQNAITPEFFLEENYGLSRNQLEAVLANATNKSGIYSDIFFQQGMSEGLSLDKGIIQSPYRNVVGGAGVRVVAGDKTGYSFTDSISAKNLMTAAKTAGAIVRYGNGTQPIVAPASSIEANHNLYALDNSLLTVPLSEKIALLRLVDETARAIDPRITNVSASINMSEQVVVIATALGELVLDRRPMLSLSVVCLAEEGNRRETGRSAGGGRVSFSYLFEKDRWRKHAETAAREAINQLSSIAAPAGEMTVVLGPGWPGVLVHEAIGHPLELDANRKNQSVFAGKLGELIASPLCTLVDDGTIADKRGSLNVDDEGTPTQRTVLIEDGILKNYMADRMNAALMDTVSTGNGRREDYRCMPMPRMTNTFMMPGQSTPEEIISSVKFGIYAYYFGGGQVDWTSGNFTFSANGARLIRNGELAEFVKGATLIDNAAKALMNISMVGHDWALDEGMGSCGKEGQSVPVGVGVPTVRLDNITVGGTGS